MPDEDLIDALYGVSPVRQLMDEIYRDIERKRFVYEMTLFETGDDALARARAGMSDSKGEQGGVKIEIPDENIRRISGYSGAPGVGVSGLHGETPKSLDAFKARLCDCGNPICFGTLSSQDVEWLFRYAQKLKRKVARASKREKAE